MTVEPGHILSLTIDKPAAGGRMIGRVDGQVVLVSGAIPGERVRARVQRVAKGVVHAETVAVDDASSDRRPSQADPACGGCLYAHIAYARQLDLKSLVIADAFGRIGRLPLPAPVTVAPSPEAGYRMRARLHVQGRRIGFFREGTHQLCDAAQTRQLLPATIEALSEIAAVLGSLGSDVVREIVLAENADATERAIHLDTSGTLTPETLTPETLDALAAIGGVSGIVASGGATRGSAYVTDVIAPASGTRVSLRRHVLAFFQGNRFLFRDLVAHVTAQVPTGAEVLDLYAGGGAFAVGAAAGCGARVTAIEGDRFAADDLAANCAATNGAVRPERRAVEAFVGSTRLRPQVVIADPPRTGMSREALDGALRLAAQRLVYVSCDVATLARDARRVVDAGYMIDRIDAFDLFPNTPHVETVVVFRNP